MPPPASPMPPRVAILGGGYAALAAAGLLAKQAPGSHITVIAPRKAHIKTTRLHETLRHSLRRVCEPYAGLGRRLGFDFIQAKPRFGPDSLPRWQGSGSLRLDGQEVRFDYLIIATGANPVEPAKMPQVLGVGDFCLNRGQTAIRELCERKGKAIALSVVGGGATGIQFLFEVSAYLRRHARSPCRLRLVNYERDVLGQFPARFRAYAYGRMARADIDYLPETAFVRQEDGGIVLLDRGKNSEYRLPSDLTLSFLGTKPNPFPLEANCHGQAIVGGKVLERIFAAGDCVRFAGAGANTLSAQVAIRKGRTVAANILAHHHAGPLRPYGYAEQGYFVSLGPGDCVGWLETPDNILTGLAAATVKAAIEKQYGLLLAGIDTYT